MEVELNDRKTFVITAGENGDEDEEIEMIRPNDLLEIVDLQKDDEKYKPLHSHVEHYNRRAAEAAKKYSSYISDLEINLKENHFIEEEKPFIAGFKHELDKYYSITAEKSKSRVLSKAKKMSKTIRKSKKKKVRRNYEKKKDRGKRDEDKENDDEKKHEVKDEDEDEYEEEEDEEIYDTENDHEKTTSTRNYSSEDFHAISDLPERFSVPKTEKIQDFENEHTTTVGNASPVNDKNVNKDITEGKTMKTSDDSESANKENPEETYDYESLRVEYELQIEEAKKNNLTYNITDMEEPEEGSKDAIKKIVDFELPKNCTEEELSKFGGQALACLAHDYQKAKNHTEVQKIISKTWRVMKIWICIYICIAVPAWCQKGWCCCCFRCSVCFPHERISVAKAYYARNEPGILVDQPGKKNPEPLHYKPTLFEIDAYEDLESAIRNL